MQRRRFLAAAAACATLPLRAQERVWIGDMHSHLYLGGATRPVSGPLGDNMRQAGASLVAWAWVSDGRWIADTPSGVMQQSTPKPGDVWPYFESGVRRMKDHLAEQKLPLVLDRAALQLALEGQPHVVFACEGADFLEGRLEQLQQAWQMGVRHLQLVHYMRTVVGDFQTEAPRHGGLSGFGREVVAECQRLGILVDLAHCTEDAVEQALAIAKEPMVWSHSSVVPLRGHWTQTPWRARRLSTASAKAIASKGGVVGLWALSLDVGTSIGSYADRLLAMADALGEDHVAFGTDLNGLGRSAMMQDYGDVRRVVDTLQSRGLPAERVRKLAIGNYARALGAAFDGRSA